MPSTLRQNTPAVLKFGPFVAAGDGATPQTGLSFGAGDVRLSKNGAAFTARSSAAAVTHDENGYYNVPLDANDTAETGLLLVAAHPAGTRPVALGCEVLPANAFDARYGNDRLQVDVHEIQGLDATTQLANAVWDAGTVGHTINGSFGDQAKNDIDNIRFLVNVLHTDWVDGGRLDNLLDAVLNVVEADAIIDKNTDPLQWKLVLRRRGTTDVLLVKDLRDLNDNPLTSEALVVGRQVQP